MMNIFSVELFLQALANGKSIVSRWVFQRMRHRSCGNSGAGSRRSNTGVIERSRSFGARMVMQGHRHKGCHQSSATNNCNTKLPSLSHIQYRSRRSKQKLRHSVGESPGLQSATSVRQTADTPSSASGHLPKAPQAGPGFRSKSGCPSATRFVPNSRRAA